jgi:hypothetical protein
MLTVYRRDHVAAPTSALAASFAPVATELRLVNPADFIAYIHQEKFANINDIVNSSVELFFRPGTLTFGWGAEYELDWNSAPIIKLDMEFRHRAVWLVFKLVLGMSQTEVIVDYLSVGTTTVWSRQSVAQLLEAIADAQLDSREETNSVSGPLLSD